MQKLLVEAPLNTLSFGNVSYNILRALSKLNIEVALFPVGNTSIESFNTTPEFGEWLNKAVSKRWDFVADKVPTLKLWHLNGGENRKTPTQNLLTFYECSMPTVAEIAVCKSQEKTLFSSTYAKDLFEAAGCDNTAYVPMGFDEDFKPTNKKYLEGVFHFGLMGKFEKRKHTENIIRTWLKAYGNDNRFQLTCCVTNPFFSQEQMSNILHSVLEGKRYTNINFLPYLKTNAEVNDFMNSIDIDLTGLSGGEGWNLPAFNATCLGKWSVVLNATSHKDWANADNSILVEPNGFMPVYDGAFFTQDSPYNQGSFFTWDQDQVIEGMEKAVLKCKSVNKKGIELASSMTYENTAKQILKSFE